MGNASVNTMRGLSCLSSRWFWVTVISPEAWQNSRVKNRCRKTTLKFRAEKCIGNHQKNVLFYRKKVIISLKINIEKSVYIFLLLMRLFFSLLNKWGLCVEWRFTQFQPVRSLYETLYAEWIPQALETCISV